MPGNNGLPTLDELNATTVNSPQGKPTPDTQATLPSLDELNATTANSPATPLPDEVLDANTTPNAKNLKSGKTYQYGNNVYSYNGTKFNFLYSKPQPPEPKTEEEQKSPATSPETQQSTPILPNDLINFDAIKDPYTGLKPERGMGETDEHFANRVMGYKTVTDDAHKKAMDESLYNTDTPNADMIGASAQQIATNTLGYYLHKNPQIKYGDLSQDQQYSIWNDAMESNFYTLQQKINDAKNAKDYQKANAYVQNYNKLIEAKNTIPSNFPDVMQKQIEQKQADEKYKQSPAGAAAELVPNALINGTVDVFKGLMGTAGAVLHQMGAISDNDFNSGMSDLQNNDVIPTPSQEKPVDGKLNEEHPFVSSLYSATSQIPMLLAFAATDGIAESSAASDAAQVGADLGKVGEGIADGAGEYGATKLPIMTTLSPEMKKMLGMSITNTMLNLGNNYNQGLENGMTKAQASAYSLSAGFIGGALMSRLPAIGQLKNIPKLGEYADLGINDIVDRMAKGDSFGTALTPALKTFATNFAKNTGIVVGLGFGDKVNQAISKVYSNNTFNPDLDSKELSGQLATAAILSLPFAILGGGGKWLEENHFYNESLDYAQKHPDEIQPLLQQKLDDKTITQKQFDDANKKIDSYKPPVVTPEPQPEGSRERRKAYPSQDFV